MGDRQLTALLLLEDGRLAGLVEYGGQPPSVVVGVPGEPPEEHVVTSSKTMRDGGTRHLETAAGRLHLRPPGHEERPSWAGSPGTALEVERHALTRGGAAWVVAESSAPSP